MSIVRIMNLGNFVQGETAFTSRHLMLFSAVRQIGNGNVPPGAGWLTRAIAAPVGGKPLIASIRNGAWVASCECGGTHVVDPADPVFFCSYCRNAAVEGAWRPVTFPENREQIEAEVIEQGIRDSCHEDPEGEYGDVDYWLNWKGEYQGRWRLGPQDW